MRVTLAVLTLLTMPDPVVAQATGPLPQGFRARVWAHTAGVQVGTLLGQLESWVVVGSRMPATCRELVAERITSGSIGGDFFLARQREFRVARCPEDLVAIPGPDVYRIDMSQGRRGTTEVGAVLGYLTGLTVTIIALAQEPNNSFGDVVMDGAVIGGLAVGPVAALVGALLGSMFDGERWRQVR